MSRVNLDLQVRFLRQLEDALDDALVRYKDAGEDKREELDYMRREVARARRIVGDRLTVDTQSNQPTSQHAGAALRELSL